MQRRNRSGTPLAVRLSCRSVPAYRCTSST